eukprot:SAG31_NODE_3537_length_4145_cov_3.205141_2_plen_99_part_00
MSCGHHLAAAAEGPLKTLMSRVMLGEASLACPRLPLMPSARKPKRSKLQKLQKCALFFCLPVAPCRLSLCLQLLKRVRFSSSRPATLMLDGGRCSAAL